MQKTTYAALAVIACAIVVLGIVFAGPKKEISVGGTTKGDTSTRNLTVTGTASITGATALTGNLSVAGSLKNKEAVSSIAATSVIATTTLTAANSGTTYYISASGTAIVLPAVTNTGATYRFVIGGAVDTGNVIITSAEGDNIDGTLIVAGAVVDCRGEDFVNFIADGEQLGDYVEVRSNGTQWFIGDSGVLTAAKMTCTDPS